MERWRRAAVPDPKASVKFESDGLHATTSIDTWGFATIFDQMEATQAGEYVFELQYWLLSGHIAFGALSAGQDKWIGQAEWQVGTSVKTAVFSVVLRAGEKVWLLTTNNNPESTSPEFVIMGVKAFRKRE